METLIFSSLIIGIICGLVLGHNRTPTTVIVVEPNPKVATPVQAQSGCMPLIIVGVVLISLVVLQWT